MNFGWTSIFTPEVNPVCLRMSLTMLDSPAFDSASVVAKLAWVAWIPWLAALGLLRPRLRTAAVSGAIHFAALHAFNCWWFYLVLRGHGALSPPVALGSSLVSLLGPAPYGLVVGLNDQHAADRLFLRVQHRAASPDLRQLSLQVVDMGLF